MAYRSASASKRPAFGSGKAPIGKTFISTAHRFPPVALDRTPWAFPCGTLFPYPVPSYNECLPLPLERSGMPLDWTPLVEIVHRHQRFLLTTHIRPDGDGLGSML